MGICGCFEIRKINKNFLRDKEEDELRNIKLSSSILKPKYTIYQEKIIEKKEEKTKNINKTINEDDKIPKKNKYNKNTICSLNKSENDNSTLSINRYNKNNNINKNNIEEKVNKEINIVLIGEKQSGKSSFIIQIAEKRFENIYIPTVFIENISKILTYNNKKYILNFNVTPGVQEYKEDYSKLYSQANFIFVFYDISVQGSFTKTKNFVKKELKNKIVMYNNNYSNIFIVANKIDKSSFHNQNIDARKYWENMNLQYFEISVKNNIGVGYMINKLLAIYEQISS
jgi:Rab family protein